MHDIFEKFAEIATQRFFAKEASLNEAIIKLAQENDLNTEQIKRVVECANTKASLQVMDESDDRLTEFDVAEPSVIIKAVYSDEDKPRGCGCGSNCACGMKTASTTDYSTPYVTQEAREKTASADEVEPVSDVVPAERTMSRHHAIQHLEKVAAEAVSKGWENVYEYQDGIEKLADAFSRVGSDFQAFENDAIAFMGLKCAADLGNLRKAMKLPLVNYESTQEKLAADRHFAVVEVTPGLRILGGLVEKRASLDHNLKVRDVAEAKLADVRKG